MHKITHEQYIAVMDVMACARQKLHVLNMDPVVASFTDALQEDPSWVAEQADDLLDCAERLIAAFKS